MRKPIAVVLTLVLLFSLFSPLRTAELSAGDALLSAVATGSTVLSCFSVTALPLALLSGLAGKDFSLADSFYPVPRNSTEKKNKPRPVSPDMAFTVSGMSLKAPARGPVSLSSGALPCMFRLQAGTDRHCHDPGGGRGLLLFLLLAYLVLLSRSNLPPAVCRAIGIFFRETRPYMNGRVSSFFTEQPASLVTFEGANLSRMQGATSAVCPLGHIIEEQRSSRPKGRLPEGAACFWAATSEYFPTFRSKIRQSKVTMLACCSEGTA